MNAVIYLAIAIVAEVIATSALKASSGFSKLLPSLAVIVGYGCAFYFLSLTLKSIPMGVAYAIWCGIGIALISAIGWLVYKQPLDGAAMVGISLIIAGVIVLSVFSKAGAH